MPPRAKRRLQPASSSTKPEIAKDHSEDDEESSEEESQSETEQEAQEAPKNSNRPNAKTTKGAELPSIAKGAQKKQKKNDDSDIKSLLKEVLKSQLKSTANQEKLFKKLDDFMETQQALELGAPPSTGGTKQEENTAVFGEYTVFKNNWKDQSTFFCSSF